MQTPEMNNVLKWSWIVLIILAAFLGALTLGALRDLRDGDPAYNVITVTGEGEMSAIPDIATFSFTVSTDAKTVSETQDGVTKKMDAILAALNDLGIEERDIKTSDYSVYPKYTYAQAACTMNYCPPGRQIQDGYTASHSVSVKVRDTEKAGDALAAAGDTGATNISAISFTVDDPAEIENEARALAIKNAKEKAEMLSDELNVRLVKVISFNDSSDGGPMPVYYRAEMANGAAMDLQSAKSPTLPTGENKVKIYVTLTYEIR